MDNIRYNKSYGEIDRLYPPRWNGATPLPNRARGRDTQSPCRPNLSPPRTDIGRHTLLTNKPVNYRPRPDCRNPQNCLPETPSTGRYAGTNRPVRSHRGRGEGACRRVPPDGRRGDRRGDRARAGKGVEHRGAIRSTNSSRNALLISPNTLSR